MRYWDASAILPLIVEEPRSGALSALVAADAAMAVAWHTRVEIASALARLERERRLDERGLAAANAILARIAARWTEIPALERVREQALRVLRLHPLRAADALQLASALVLCDFEPRTLPLVTMDARLAQAARREGFETLGESRPDSA